MQPLRQATHGLALLAVAAGWLASAVALAQKNPTTPPPADLPGHVNYLAQQLPGVMLEDATPITDQIEKLVLADLRDWMLDRTPSGVEARREVDMAFSELQYPLFGRGAAFARKWKDQVVIGAGYTLGWTDYDRTNVIAIFLNQGGHSHLVTVAHFVPHTDIHYTFVQEPDGPALRFFVHGLRLGESQLRLTAILYAFDGQSLKSQWEVHDLYGGKMDVEKDKVVIRYLIEGEIVHNEALRRTPPRHQTTYNITPTGLEVQSEQEIPY